MLKGTKQKPVQAGGPGRGLSLPMDFDEVMRRAVRVKPEKKPAKRKK